MQAEGTLGVVRGAGLYVGALIGPGVLLVPALAVEAAGPASILAWGAVLVLSVPLAITFAELGVRHPVAGGVTAYVRERFGGDGAAVTGGCFICAVLVGGPAIALIVGYYVADLTGSGTAVAAAVGLAIFGTVLVANVFGLRVSSAFQLVLAAVLIGVLAIACAVALPARATDNWQPFAPHGWWAVGTAANILIWLVIGLEAVAQLAGDFRNPAHDLPRAMALAFVLVGAIYLALAVATIGVTAGTTSRVPLADLIAVGFGRAGRDATAVLAVALTMGTMNVYMSGTAKLVAALAQERVLPGWLAGDAQRSVPRRPLLVIACVGVAVLVGLLVGIGSTGGLVRATSACFIAVYVLVFLSAVSILDGRLRLLALVTLALIVVLAAFSSWYLLVPVVAGAVAFAMRRSLRQRSTLTV